MPKKTIYKLGIGSQTIATIFTWGIITYFRDVFNSDNLLIFWTLYLFIIFFGILGSLGSTLMEISVSFDLAADQIDAKELPLFNSRLKRIDLFTEVTAPLFAGVAFLLPNTSTLNIGFTFIAVLNFLTFIPEYLLLASIDGIDKSLKPQNKALYINPLQELKAGIAEFNDDRFVIPMVAYAFLWLSVLSPHGVLLSGYLKDGKNLSELLISIFRGLGAFFGMIPTFLFPLMRKKYGLIKTSKFLLGFQLVCILIATIAFQIEFIGHLYVFLSMILASRIGLYGFSIAESEARQVYIPSYLRGRINGVGASLTNFATLILFGAGTLLPTSNDFNLLVWMSFFSVLAGFLILLRWNPHNNK